jgi:hypothetical protein
MTPSKAVSNAVLLVVAVVVAGSVSTVSGQNVKGQFTFKCGDTAYNCGSKVQLDTMCILGPKLKVVTNDPGCAKMANDLKTLKSPAIFTTRCPNGKLMQEYVQYNTQGKSGKKYDKHGSAPCKGARCGGDPHFLTYDGTSYSYHGQCDLVMAHSKDINGLQGIDLDIHSRTKIKADWSYMSNVAIRLGNDILEITSAGDHFLNGEANVAFPFLMSNHFNVTLNQKEVFPGQYRADYVIDLEHMSDIEKGGNDVLRISAFKDLLSVNVEAILPDTYGMLGVMGKDGMIGRDRKTEITDVNEMGQEWQVLDTEPMLFREVAAPQYPAKCMLPQPKSKKAIRMLRSGEDEEDTTEQKEQMRRANEVCADVIDDDMRNFCIQDVLMSGDHEVAGLYHGH